MFCVIGKNSPHHWKVRLIKFLTEISVKFVHRKIVQLLLVRDPCKAHAHFAMVKFRNLSQHEACDWMDADVDICSLRLEKLWHWSLIMGYCWWLNSETWFQMPGSLENTNGSLPDEQVFWSYQSFPGFLCPAFLLSYLLFIRHRESWSTIKILCW